MKDSCSGCGGELKDKRRNICEGCDSKNFLARLKQGVYNEKRCTECSGKLNDKRRNTCEECDFEKFSTKLSWG